MKTVPDANADPAAMPDPSADQPPDLPPSPMPSTEGLLAVPLAALAQPDDKEQVNEPAEGDTTTFTVDAMVVRVVDGIAYIKPVAVNGTQLDDASGADAPSADEQEGADLRSMSAAQSQ